MEKTKDSLSYKIIGCAMEVYNALGPGLLEAAYEKALIHEQQLSGLSVASHEFMIFSHRSHESHKNGRIVSLASVGVAECIQPEVHTSDSACAFVRFVRSV